MEGQVEEELIAARTEKLFFYSPYHAIRSLDASVQQTLFGTGRAKAFGTQPAEYVFSFPSGNNLIQCLYTFLPWDTDFFGLPVYRLFTVLYALPIAITEITQAIVGLQAYLTRQYDSQSFYLFAEIPAEDTILAQALGKAGGQLVETRLTYFQDQVATFDYPRFPVRPAQVADADVVGKVAVAARNPYDRFHAETCFSPELADAFVARYAIAAVQGYCDEVLVPADTGVPVASFLAISDLHEHAAKLRVGLSRVVLTAVAAANRGWHRKLVAETVQRAKSRGASCVLMTTQATNYAVFRTCEKLGFKLGGCSHVFSFAGH